jgi:hypothetical protein
VALRPVSELGLVEVTDVAAHGRSPRASSPKPQSPKTTERTKAPARKAADVEGRAGGTAGRVGASILSATIGAGGAVLVARAILRR